MLETYAEMPTLIPIDVTEDVVKLVAGKLLVSTVPVGTDSK